jgi:hypothetical protein
MARIEWSNAKQLSDGATITPDCREGGLFYVTLGGNRTMAAPLNPSDGQYIVFRVKQDGGGNRTLTWNAAYRFSTDLPAPTLTTTGGKMDMLGFVYNTQDSKWDYVTEIKGF